LNTHLYLLQLFKYWSFEVVGGWAVMEWSTVFWFWWLYFSL
jgi:hypothetical protein